MSVMRGSRVRLIVWMVLLLLGLVPAAGLAQDTQSPAADVVEIEGVIDPTMFEYITGRLAAAQRDGAHVVIMRMDTPGGLDVSMRDIIKDMLASEVPVVVWIAPQGARAASAGTFISYAAHRAYMAQATEIGAASPVNLGGDVSPTLERKAANDAAAFIRELALERDRNPEWAESAVIDAASIGATEAAEIGVVDGIASSLRDLLQELDGEVVETASGTRTLETWDETLANGGGPSVTIRFQEMNVLQRLLHAITDPNIAFYLVLFGMFGIIFELYNPGIGLAGIMGGVALLLGFYALSVLPTNWAGVLLIVLAVAFLLVDLHTAGLGVWTAGGVAALIAGGLLLFSGAVDTLRVGIAALVGAVAVTLLFFISVMTAALLVRLRRPVMCDEGMMGLIGEARTDIAPEGTVFAKGTLWRARTMETGIAAGSKVKVMASEGLVLLVEPVHEAQPEA